MPGSNHTRNTDPGQALNPLLAAYLIMFVLLIFGLLIQ